MENKLFITTTRFKGMNLLPMNNIVRAKDYKEAIEKAEKYIKKTFKTLVIHSTTARKEIE